jgi:hypothetical protein
MRFLSSCFFLLLVLGVEQPLVTEQLDGLLALFFVALLQVLNQLWRYWAVHWVCADGVDVERLEEFFDSHNPTPINCFGRPGRLRGVPSFLIPQGAPSDLTIAGRVLVVLFLSHVASISKSLILFRRPSMVSHKFSFSVFEMNTCFSLFEPQPHAVDDSDWEHQSSSNEEAPQALTEASEDVIEPSREAG